MRLQTKAPGANRGRGEAMMVVLLLAGLGDGGADCLDVGGADMEDRA